jgi:gluconate 2-dehydrogenase gamma chain
MGQDGQPGADRRTFLKSAMAGSAAAATGAAGAGTALAQGTRPAPAPAATAAGPTSPSGYVFLTPDEGAFVEALVDHMIPADALTPSGTALGIHVYIDRALASGWGQGARLYRQGPWKSGTANQGYQLPLTPAQLWREGIAATDAHCLKAWGRRFDQLASADRQGLLVAMQGGKVSFAGGPPARTFFAMAYQNVMEGLFADPIYGGNRDKAGWKMIGFPGVVAVHARNIDAYRGRAFPAGNPLGIADMS